MKRRKVVRRKQKQRKGYDAFKCDDVYFNP